MFKAIRRLFTTAEPPNALWKVMEDMDPWLSYARFQALQLPKRQRPLVKGLVEGSVKPSEIDEVRRWAERHDEDYDGIASLIYALQHAMDSRNVHYLFEQDVVVPTARLPYYVDDQSLTVLFNDRENHLQIASVEEFTKSNDISDYVLQPLTFRQYETRIERRAEEYLGAKISHADKGQSLYKGRRISVSITRKVNADESIEVAVTAADVVEALAADGISVAIEDVQLEEPIHEAGLFNATVQVEPGVSKKISVWIVPAVDGA